jgi:fibronectin type 3 domain-containing protein
VAYHWRAASVKPTGVPQALGDPPAVRWLPLATPGVAGYRILRSVSAGGPYEVVGESTGGIFNDVAVEHGRTYYYVVQAFDGAGVTSALSREIGGALARLTAYLPLLGR